MTTTFKEYMDFDTLCDQGAAVILKKNIDPQAIQELADLYEGFWGNAARMAGGIGGTMLGSALGPAGAIGGAMLGSGLAGKFAQGFGSQKGYNTPHKDMKISPLFQQAKQSFGNLVNTLTSVQQHSPGAQEMLANGQNVLGALQQMEPETRKADGMSAEPAAPGFFGRMKNKVTDFAGKHPRLMRSLGTGLQVGAGYALGQAFGHHGDTGGGHGDLGVNGAQGGVNGALQGGHGALEPQATDVGYHATDFTPHHANIEPDMGDIGPNVGSSHLPSHDFSGNDFSGNDFGSGIGNHGGHGNSGVHFGADSHDAPVVQMGRQGPGHAWAGRDDAMAKIMARMNGR